MTKPVETAAAHPALPEHQLKEMSLSVALRKVADDLFTYETVAEKVQGSADEEQITALIEHYKQVLVEHWTETGWRTIEDFRAHIDSLAPETDLSAPTPSRDDAAPRLS